MSPDRTDGLPNPGLQRAGKTAAHTSSAHHRLWVVQPPPLSPEPLDVPSKGCPVGQSHGHALSWVFFTSGYAKRR
jgi:hypothetical protein